MGLRSIVLVAALLAASAALAQCPPSVPVEGGSLPPPLPLFPATNWWNQDIRTAPVDPNSASYVAFINNGGTRRLHPDFGGEVSPGSIDIYGMPYVVVNGSQPKVAVTFDYSDESDGVNHTTNQSFPFYPIPTQAATQAHFVEGGAPGEVDQRSSSDRHLLIVDCTNRYLYELYNVWYDANAAQWYAGSGAFFDMNTDNRRPDGWTSADAAGLAILPGLVRYDEAWNAAIADIGHAFRVTVRATNGYVYPASHRAGSTAGALPMGARLRLKSSVNGADPALRTSDPNVQKIFRAMQKYGLIVADNGSDLYITGTFDTRWNNGILNPAFGLLSASDFEVVQLGWKPAGGAAAALSAVSANPATVTAPNGTTGTVTLTASAPSGGATIALTSDNAAAKVPASVSITQGSTTGTFAITSSTVATSTTATITASYAGTSKTTTVTVNPPPAALTQLSLSPASVAAGNGSTGTVTLTAAAPAGGTLIALSSASTAVKVPASVTVAQGATSATFAITTSSVSTQTLVTVSASCNGVTKTSTLTVNPVVTGPTLASLSVAPGTITGGTKATGTVALTAAATGSGASVALASGNPNVLSVPSSALVPAGQSSVTFPVTTTRTTHRGSTVTVSATYAGVTRTTTVTVKGM